MATDTPHDSRITLDSEPLQDDAEMDIFGCDFMEELAEYLELPEVGDETTIFTGARQQKKAL